MHLSSPKYFILTLIGFILGYVYLYLNQYRFFRKNVVGQIFPFVAGIGGAILIVYSHVMMINNIGRSSIDFIPFIGWILIVIAGLIFVLSWELNFKTREYTEEDRFLYTKGMYALSRNPQTFSFFLVFFGEIFYTLNYEMVSFSVMNMILMYIYIRLEERLDLERKFGKKYKKYTEQTPFIFPTLSSIKNCFRTFWGKNK